MRKFILGTDWWTDCDDVVAARVLSRFIKQNKIELLGVGINACMEYSVSSLDGFFQNEGLTDIPLAIDLEATDYGGNPPYQKRLADYAVKYKCNEDAEDAVRLYRRLMAQAHDKIEIIEIGFLQVMSAVLESDPDDISPLSGMELVKNKVSKIWVMAGKWDEKPGKEHNFNHNLRSCNAGYVFCEKCPVPITFLGWEVGASVITGGELSHNDHLYTALCDHGSHNGRSSWDPMLVLLAIIGDEQQAGYDTVCGRASVDAATGENYFAPCDNGPHKYVVKKFDDEYYKDTINEIIA